MSEFTLLTVNWNQKEALEVMLKSFIRTHGDGRYPLIIIDNGSTDASRQWMLENELPYITYGGNIGHEQAVCAVYPHLKGRILLVDTDIEFKQPVWEYSDGIERGEYAMAGEYITNDIPVIPRICPWFMMFDVDLAKSVGISKFRDTENWSYDVGSFFTEKMLENGFKYHHTTRIGGHLDNSIEGMVYEKYVHFGKVSWNITTHHDRTDEVTKRREHIKNLVNSYADIDLKGKFFLP